jgi:hypothetical protein
VRYIFYLNRIGFIKEAWGGRTVMDKAVMIGVFDFVNFHVCKALLDKGIEVRGVDIETEKNELFLTEKKLEIGRNANFSLVTIEDLIAEPQENEAIVLSIYDLYMQHREELLLNEMVKDQFMNHWEQLVILAPSQLLTQTIEPEAAAVIQEFMDEIKANNKNLQLLYLPTVYGPWQLETFMFQHSILTEKKKGSRFKGLREETNDALFVEDTVEVIIEIADKRVPGKYLLQNGENNQWNLCAAFLKIDQQISSGRNIEAVKEEITKCTVKNTIPISVSLTKQIEHTRRMNC